MEQAGAIEDDTLQQSAERYAAAGRHIFSMLERRLVEPLPAQTGHAIVDTMVLACYTDAALDGQVPTSLSSTKHVGPAVIDYLLSPKGSKQLPDFFTPCSATATRLQAYVSSHDDMGRDRLQKDFLSYCEIDQALCQLKEPRLYALYSRLEGKVSMRIILDLLPPGVRDNPDNGQTLQWMLRLGQIGNTFDSLTDSTTDVRSGRTVAGSPMRLRTALMGVILRDLFPVMRGFKTAEYKQAVQDTLGVLRGTQK
jgi:hypothetical protein